MPSLPMVVEALALRAEKDGTPQPVPARLLRDIADALKHLPPIVEHPGIWERIVRAELRRRGQKPT